MGIPMRIILVQYCHGRYHNDRGVSVDVRKIATVTTSLADGDGWFRQPGEHQRVLVLAIGRSPRRPDQVFILCFVIDIYIVFVI
jgi:hypothetical protein